MFRQAVLKLNRLCNLSCDYCYYINLNTPSPGSKISLDVVDNFLDKFVNYLEEKQIQAPISFHGGEPTLMGIPFFKKVLSHRGFKNGTIKPVLQTNGTKISSEWIDLFRTHNFSIGISLDGGKTDNDAHRKYVGGQGSFDRVVNSISKLLEAGIPTGVLCVANPSANGKDVYTAIRSLGIDSIDLLLPMVTHEDIKEDEDYRVSLRRYVIEFFTEWLKESALVRNRLFDNMFARAIGEDVEFSGLGPIKNNKYLVLETNGSIHHEEDLFTHEVRDTKFGALVRALDSVSHFDEFEKDVDEHMLSMGASNVSSGCKNCSVLDLCGSGAVITRYKRDSGYHSRSVHCDTLFFLAGQIKRLTNDESVKPNLDGSLITTLITTMYQGG